MSKNYKEEINKIVMNDAMKKRILQNVFAANETSEDQNTKVETKVSKVKKYNNLKRNMQMAAACFAVVLCLSIAKNYPMLLKSSSNDIKQNQMAKSDDEENNDVETSEDNELVNNKDSKETLSNDHKDDQDLDQNNNAYKDDDGSEKEESKAISEIVKEEKNKYNLQTNSSSEAAKNQTAQNNDDNTKGNSNISSETNPEEAVNNKENKNLTGTEYQTPSGDIKENKIPGNDANSNASDASVMGDEAINYSQEYKTLDEAEKTLNLKVNSLKTLPKGFKMENISVISNEIIQVEYNDGNSNIAFRAGKGIDNISGDYNVYQIKNTVKVNGINVNLEGNKNEEYNLAVWEKDGISYSISTKNGIDEKTILNMIL